MTGVATGDRGIPIPRSLQKRGQPNAVFSGVPGHLIAGAADYTALYASAVIYELATPYGEASENGQPLNAPSLNAARRKVLTGSGHLQRVDDAGRISRGRRHAVLI